MTDSIGIEELSFLEGLREEDSIHEERKGDDWGINDSTYEAYFSSVRLRGYPEGVLQLMKAQLEGLEEPAGVDIAGGTNGIALQGLINAGVIDRGMATNYKDKRGDFAKENPNLDHIAGNIIFPQTWISIINWVRDNAPDGAALIMHRPYGGLQGLYPSFYKGAAHKLLDLLRPGGMLFAQIPYPLQDRPGFRNTTLCQEIRERPDIAELILPVELGRKATPMNNCAVVIKN